MAKTVKRSIGDMGEAMAAHFLIQAGYEIVAKNYQIRGGEIDIIAWHKKVHHGKTLCFVEVKTRGVVDGSAERATGREKIHHMLKAARSYCIAENIDTERTPIQFEQVSVYTSPSKEPEFCLYVIPIE